MRRLVTIVLGITVAMSWSAAQASGAPTIADCKDTGRFHTPREQGECFVKTNDPKAIPELYRMARENIAKMDKDDDDIEPDAEFWLLAEYAGKIAAWTDYGFLASKTKSTDVYDQGFGLEGLAEMLDRVYFGPEDLSKRIVRFNELSPKVKPVCEPLLKSSAYIVQSRAEKCLFVAKESPSDDIGFYKKGPPPGILLRDRPENRSKGGLGLKSR